jgi:uncharacterized membrane protein YjjP (DUF1212 family)
VNQNPPRLTTARYGPVGAVAAAAASALAVVGAFALLDLPSWIPCVVGAFAMYLETEIGKRRSEYRPLFRAACWLAAGAWASIVLLTGWSWTAAAVLAGAVLVGVLLAPAVARTD